MKQVTAHWMPTWSRSAGDRTTWTNCSSVDVTPDRKSVVFLSTDTETGEATRVFVNLASTDFVEVGPIGEEPF
jgi:hypothetical protein